MKLKVIVTDLDGTLLNKKRWISKTNLLNLKEFIKDGGEVCFVTGRSLDSSRRIAKIFKSKTGYDIKYIACFNGAIIYDNINNKIIEETTINHEVVTDLFNTSRKFSLGFTEYYKDLNNKKIFINVYGYDFLVNIIRFFNKKTSYYKIKKNNLKIENVYKINIVKKFDTKSFNSMQEFLTYADIKNISFSLTSSSLIEITPQNIDKGYAVKRISELLSVPLDEFIAFGDSPNDIPMLKIIKNSFITKDKRLDSTKYFFNKKFKPKNSIGNWLESKFYK